MELIKKYLKVIGVVLFILLEEILWNKIGLPIYNSIKSLKIMEKFKNYITNIKQHYLLLLIFISPIFVDLILTWLFGIAMAHLMIFTAIGIYVLKALMSILMVVIFQIGKKQLIEFFIIRYGYGCILRFKRSRTFREVRKYTRNLKDEFKSFKNNYLNGDGEFKEELKKSIKILKNYSLQIRNKNE